MDNNDLVRLAVDNYKGRVCGNYSTSESSEALRMALIDANGGSPVLDYRAVRDGKCNGLFALMEEIITKTVVEGLHESSPIFDFIEWRNIKDGDS